MNQTIDTSPIGAASLAAARKVQRRRAIRIVSFFVVLPTLVVAIYTGLVKTRFYESVAQVAIESTGTDASSARHDATFIREFARSHDGLAYLTSHAGYREHFASRSIDPLSRLSRTAANDEAYEHFQRHVDVELDAETGFLWVRCRAHSGAAAQRLTRSLVEAMAARASRLGDGEPPIRRLAVISTPTRPDVIAGPKPLRSIATTLFGSVALLIVASIVISTAREHADV